MNKLLSIMVLLAVAVCSCHGIMDRRNIRSAGSEVSGNIDPITVDTIAPRDLETADTNDVFTARVKKGGNKNKEMLHMGLSFVKMILGTLTAAIGHVFAFKSVGLSLISVLIQIAQFIMVLKKNKDSQPPSYKIVETPWHMSPTESYGAYGSYAGHAKSAAAAGGYNASPYAAAAPPRRRR